MERQLTHRSGALSGDAPRRDSLASYASSHSSRYQERRSEESRLEDIERESYAEGLPEGLDASHSEKSEGFSPSPVIRYANVSIYANILAGSIWGVLARKGIMALTEYSGSYVKGVIWANFVACFVMGALVRSEMMWAGLLDESLFATKASIPLYAGLATGFCGSCSSFSSFIMEIFSYAANLPPTASHYPNAAYGILNLLQVLAAQMTVSFGGFRSGTHFSSWLDKKKELTLAEYRILDLTNCILGLAAYIVVIVLVATESEGAWRSWTLLCLFAPYGAILRFYLSKRLNAMIDNFPLGTFTANFGGTTLLTIFTLLTRGKAHVTSMLPIVSDIQSCHVLVALDDGFCGCLTTVSTFVVELSSLKLRYSSFYGTVSILLSFSMIVLIAGSYNWAVGFTSAVC